MADSHPTKNGKLTPVDGLGHYGNKDTHVAPCDCDLCPHYMATFFHKAKLGKGDHFIRLHIDNLVDCEHTDTTGVNESRSNLGAGTKCPFG